MAGKTAVIRWGGHRVLRRSVVQAHASRLKEASPGRVTRLSRKVEHRLITAHVTHSNSLLLLSLYSYTNHSTCVRPWKAKQNKTVGADRIKYKINYDK